MGQTGQTDRPYVIQISETRPVRRLSLPNTVYNDLGNERTRTPLQDNSLWTPNAGLSQRDIGRSNMNADYIQETIFYDPFDDRRIDVSKTPTRPVQEFGPFRAAPPVPPSNNNTGYPPPVVYNSHPSDDGFRLPPLPVLDTPEPPPAYTEIDEQRDRQINREPAVSQVYRGQQIAVGSPRKLIVCPSCGMRVYTIVIRESGALTHVIATIVFFLFLPVVFCVYLTDLCKYKNHYCPNCNNMIGYEIPLLCTQMVYPKSYDQQVFA